MANYFDWNQALIDYFTRGVEKGSRVYLSVDDDVLERIGKKFNSVPHGNSWRNDFCYAVRRRLGVTNINGGNQIDLTFIKDSVSRIPHCVAFLGITVLAAYDMASDTNASVDERNYYRRFREALNLTTSEFNAPRGMILAPRIEAILWNRWDNWLKSQNLLPTVRQGTRATKYIGYAISQSILRRADKERIYRLVQEQGLINDWEIDSLMNYLNRNIESLTPHLRALLTGIEDDRRLVIRKAVQDALEEERNVQTTSFSPIPISRTSQNGLIGKRLTPDNSNRVLNYDISAQVYRTEGDCFFSQYPDFYLYPKQRTGVDLFGANVLINAINPLPTLQKSDLDGWYSPIIERPITPLELSQGVKHQITRDQSSDNSTNWLTLDRKNFWVLTPHPEYPESGIYASFGKVTLGQRFILLCQNQKALIKTVECLQNEQILRFYQCVEAFENNSDWVEFQQCEILSEDWEGVDLGWQGEELKNALQPTKDVAISFAGGFRVPHLRAWIVDDVPTLTVFSSFVDQVEVVITNLSEAEKLSIKRTVSTNTPHSNLFKKNGITKVGDYNVQVNCGKLSGCRNVKLIEWKDLDIREPVRKEIFQIGDWSVDGSQVYPQDHKGDIYE